MHARKKILKKASKVGRRAAALFSVVDKVVLEPLAVATDAILSIPAIAPVVLAFSILCQLASFKLGNELSKLVKRFMTKSSKTIGIPRATKLLVTVLIAGLAIYTAFTGYTSCNEHNGCSHSFNRGHHWLCGYPVLHQP